MNPASPGDAPKIDDLSPADFGARLTDEGIGLRIGPFNTHIQANVDGLDDVLFKMYRDYPLVAADEIFNFHVRLQERKRWIPGKKSVVRFTVDGRTPHEDMPAEQALAVLEWGLNLVIALRFHCFIMLHSAVVARSDRALLLPAWPGHGKTTLCAGLVNRGWRLLSDEFGLIRPGTDELIPIPRLMPLKNESIQVIRAFAPNAELGPTIPNTRKGTVCHVRPTSESIAGANRHASANWIVFPRWMANEPLSLREIPKAEAFMLLASNSFNYELIGEPAFRTLKGLVTHARCFRLVYSDLAEATATLNELADESGT